MSLTSIPLVSSPGPFDDVPLGVVRSPEIEKSALISLDAGPVEELVPHLNDVELATIKARAEELNTSSQALFEIGRDQEPAIDATGVAAITSFVNVVGQLIREVSSLAGRTTNDTENGRDPEVGRFLLALSLRQWVGAPPEGNAKLLFDLCRSRYTTEGRIRPPIAEWQQIIHQFFDGNDATHLYPDRLKYIQASEKLRAEIPDIAEAIPGGEGGDALESPSAGDQQSTRPAPRIPTPADNMRDASSKKIGAFIPTLSTAKQEKIFKKLVDEVRDVDPFKVPEVLTAVNCKISPKSTIFDFLIQSHTAISEMLESWAMKMPPGPEHRLPLLAVRDRKLTIVEGSLSCADTLEAKGLGAEILALQHALRRTLLVIARESKHFSKPTIGSAVREALVHPYENGNGSFAARLFHQFDGSNAVAAARVLMGPMCVDARKSAWRYPIASLNDADVLRWAIKNYCFANEGVESFGRLFKVSFPSELGIDRLVGGISVLVRRGDYLRLARELDQQIVSQKNSLAMAGNDGGTIERKVYRGVVLLASLAELAESDVSRERLRAQIPNLNDVRDIALGLQMLLGERSFLGKLPQIILSRFGPTLESCNLKPEDLKTLNRLVSNYRILESHPELRIGAQGNTLFKSGILLTGPPGVGKTYLTHVLTSMLGAKCFSLRPFEKVQSVDMFSLDERTDSLNSRITDKFNQVLAEAAKGTTCILEIDEAEYFLPDRSATALPDDRYATCVYLLNMMNEVRVKHPNVLIIIASNFRDKLDVAGIREGRIDLEVSLELPNAEQRRLALRAEIARHVDERVVDDAQLDSLVAITEGEIFVGMASTVNEYFIFEVIRQREQNPSYQPNFEDLRKEFEHNASERKRKQSRK